MRTSSENVNVVDVNISMKSAFKLVSIFWFANLVVGFSIGMLAFFTTITMSMFGIAVLAGS